MQKASFRCNRISCMKESSALHLPAGWSQKRVLAHTLLLYPRLVGAPGSPASPIMWSIPTIRFRRASPWAIFGALPAELQWVSIRSAFTRIVGLQVNVDVRQRAPGPHEFQSWRAALRQGGI